MNDYEFMSMTINNNIKETIEWKNNLEMLSAKGLDERLIAELYEIGPNAHKEIDALTNMTKKELYDYSNLWKEKQTIIARIMEGLK